MGSLTSAVGVFIAELRHGHIPAEALASVRNGFADYAAVTILGRNDAVTRVARAALVPGDARGDARLCFGSMRAPAMDAALIGGVAAHAQDYDDVGLVGVQPTHPSASIAPAIFAEADRLGRDGKSMLTAYVAAFEVWGELASRDADPPHLKGWHPTGTFGAIAAAAAAASLNGLDAAGSARAVAIGASMAAGVVANFGSMTKPFHAGRAAQSGVIAARLAAAGMSASADALEGDLGFLRAISPKGNVDVSSPPRFNDRWWLLTHGLGFKLFPLCYGAHRALDSTFSLLATEHFGAEDVESIVVEATKARFSNLVHTDPRNALDAKFSMEFAMAMAIIAGHATRAEFEESFVNRPDVRLLMKKVRRHILAEGSADRDGMIVMLKDGRRFERRFTPPLGDACRPAPAAALWAKFADCVAGALSPTQAREMFDRLQHIDDLKTPDDLPIAADA